MEQDNKEQSLRDAVRDMQDAMRDQNQMMQQMLQTMQAMMARMEVQNRAQPVRVEERDGVDGGRKRGFENLEAPPIRREQQRHDVGLPRYVDQPPYFENQNRWKGICQVGQEFEAKHCNKKLIEARWYTGGLHAAKEYCEWDENAKKCGAGNMASREEVVKEILNAIQEVSVQEQNNNELGLPLEVDVQREHENSLKEVLNFNQQGESEKKLEEEEEPHVCAENKSNDAKEAFACKVEHGQSKASEEACGTYGVYQCEGEYKKPLVGRCIDRGKEMNAKFATLETDEYDKMKLGNKSGRQDEKKGELGVPHGSCSYKVKEKVDASSEASRCEENEKSSIPANVSPYHGVNEYKSEDKAIIEDIKKKDLHLNNLASALKKNIQEAAILIYLLNPSPTEIKGRMSSEDSRMRDDIGEFQRKERARIWNSPRDRARVHQEKVGGSPVIPHLVRDRLFFGNISDAAAVLQSASTELTHVLSLLSSVSISFFSDWRPGLSIPTQEIRKVFVGEGESLPKKSLPPEKLLYSLEYAGPELKLVKMAVPLKDTEDENLLDYLDVCLDFIDESRSEGSVLVHCFAGVSRSAAVAPGPETEGTQNASGRTQPGNPRPGLTVLNHPIQIPQISPAGTLPWQMVIPDSLTTLSDFISRMELVLQYSVSLSSATTNARAPPRSNDPSLNLRGLPTSVMLGSVVEQAQRLLSINASNALSQFAANLERGSASTDPSVRSQIQTDTLNVLESETETDAECQTKREVNSESNFSSQGMESGSGKMLDTSCDNESLNASDGLLNKRDVSPEFSKSSDGLACVQSPHMTDSVLNQECSVSNDFSEHNYHDIVRRNDHEGIDNDLSPDPSIPGLPVESNSSEEAPKGDEHRTAYCCKKCSRIVALQDNVSHGPYLCPKHTRCHSCGSTVPGSGLSTRWFLGYTCCDACGRLFVKGKYCPVCLKVCRDSEMTPMVCCDVCEQWVHCVCDGISEEKYEQFQADGNLHYKCPACRGDCYRVKDMEDAVRELWRRRDKADHELTVSLRAAAGLPTQEEIFSICPYSDDDGTTPVMPVEMPEKVSQKVEDRVSDLQEIHATVRAKLEQTYAKYKAKADQQRRQQSFEVGDLVWVYLPRERYPQGAFTKLKPKKIGPCQILEKFGDNAYQVELPDDVFISDVFNIRHLTPYAGDNSSLRSSFSEEGESDEDIKSDQSLNQPNQALKVPVPATQSQQATSETPTPGSLRRSKRLQNKRA